MAESKKFEIHSMAFKNNDAIPKKYTGYGENRSPELSWSNPPTGTKSFALICDDPDAQQVCGYTWIHWVVKNIPAYALEIKENGKMGEEVATSFGKPGYNNIT